MVLRHARTALLTSAFVVYGTIATAGESLDQPSCSAKPLKVAIPLGTGKGPLTRFNEWAAGRDPATLKRP